MAAPADTQIDDQRYIYIPAIDLAGIPDQLHLHLRLHCLAAPEADGCHNALIKSLQRQIEVHYKVQMRAER